MDSQRNGSCFLPLVFLQTEVYEHGANKLRQLHWRCGLLLDMTSDDAIYMEY